MLVTMRMIGLLICLFFLVPYLLGMFIVRNNQDSNECESISLNIIVGMFVMFILYYFPAVIMIINKCTLTMLTNTWVIEIAILSLFSLIVNRRDIANMVKGKKESVQLWFKENILVKLLTISFIVLVILQAVLLSYSNIYDTDDARYIAESLDALHTDTMLLVHPLTGEVLEQPIGEMTKDVICPFSMFQASVSKILEIHPATLCHKVLPLFLIPLCYMVYWLLSVKIFGMQNLEKRLFFLNFVCVLLMFGRMSAYWSSAYLLWRIWQGKAILAAIIIPFLLWIMHSILQENEKKEYYYILFVTVLGSFILSPMSSIFMLLIIGMYALLLFLDTKKLSVFFRMGICCIPIGAFLVLSKVIGMVRYGL